MNQMAYQYFEGVYLMATEGIKKFESAKQFTFS